MVNIFISGRNDGTDCNIINFEDYINVGGWLRQTPRSAPGVQKALVLGSSWLRRMSQNLHGLQRVQEEYE